jgi:hypothetical protein
MKGLLMSETGVTCLFLEMGEYVRCLELKLRVWEGFPKENRLVLEGEKGMDAAIGNDKCPQKLEGI